MTEILRKYAMKRYTQIYREKLSYPRKNGKSTTDLDKLLHQKEDAECPSTK